MKKMVGIDILKIVFALMIAFFHLSIHFNVHINVGTITGMLDTVVSVGAIFMVGFFMLSGFVLQCKYREVDFSSSKNLKDFYIKRFIGIYPVYAFFLIMVLCLKWSFPDTLQKVLSLVVCDFLCLQTFFPTTFNFFSNGGTWFVSVIVFMYLLFPFFNTVIKKLGRYRNVILVVCYCLSMYVGLMQAQFGGGLAWYYSNVWMRLPEFIIGMLVAEIWVRGKQKSNWWHLPIVIVLTFLFVVAINKYYPALGSNYIQYNFIVVPYMAAILLIMANVDIKLIGGGIGYIANIAVDFYLTQTFANNIVAYGIKKALIAPTNRLMIIGVSIGFNILFAVMMHLIIEKPVKKLLYNRFVEQE